MSEHLNAPPRGWSMLAGLAVLAGVALQLWDPPQRLWPATLVIFGVGVLAAPSWMARPRLGYAGGVVAWLAMGLVCGGVDVALVSYARHVNDRVVHVSQDYFWIMPMFYAGFFAAVGLVLGFAGSLVGALRTLPVTLFWATALAAWSVARPYEWLHPLAVLGLSVVGGIVVARVANAQPVWIGAVCRWTAILATPAVVAIAVATPMMEAAAERAHIESLPAPAAGSPNVVLIVLDTVRADRCGFHGYERDTTPAMDRMAREGVVFEQAYATAPWTLTSHASMFTGRYPHEMNADWMIALNDDHRTLAEELSDRGYVTAGFVGNLGKCGREMGIDRGFAHYEDYFRNFTTFLTTPSLGREFLARRHPAAGWHEQVVSTVQRNDADRISSSFLDWLGARSDERPFFAFLNYFDAHGMYMPRRGFETRFSETSCSPEGLAFPLWRHHLWSGDQAVVDAYDSCLAFIDSEIGSMVEEMERRGIAKDTVFIITSDHGELFGEHGLYEHANSLYRPVVHIPLAIYAPGRVPAGTSLDVPVSLVDLPATVLDLVGVEPGFPGKSLVPCWDPTRGPVETSPVLAEVSKGIRLATHLPASKGPMATLFQDGLQLIRNGDGVLELYPAVPATLAPENLLPGRKEDAERLRAVLEGLTR